MQCHKASAVDMESWGKSGRIIRMLNVDCWGREMWNQNNRDWGFWGWYLRFFDFFRFFFSSWPGVCFFSILTRCLFLCILAAHNRLASSLLCGFLKSENLQFNFIFINSSFSRWLWDDDDDDGDQRHLLRAVTLWQGQGCSVKGGPICSNTELGLNNHNDDEEEEEEEEDCKVKTNLVRSLLSLTVNLTRTLIHLTLGWIHNCSNKHYNCNLHREKNILMHNSPAACKKMCVLLQKATELWIKMWNKM